MKILTVAELYPWPAVDGYRQRLDHIVRALARVGEVRVFTPARTGTGHELEPCPVPGVEVATAPVRLRGARERYIEWPGSGLPRRPLTFDWSEARDALRALDPRPDVVWYSHIDAWWPVHDLFEGVPAVVDFDNLEDIALRLRRRQPPRAAPGTSLPAKAVVAGRWAASRVVDVADERRWADIQRRCAAEVDRVVVCSQLDAQRAGAENVTVVANGAARPEGIDTDRRHLRGDVPSMMFVGALDYEPNAEAVEWFVREVLPLVRARRRDAVVRIVGRGSATVGWVADVPGVRLLGQVDSIRAELDRADVSVVPIRAGAGTRLKVVEAMAHHLPLVSTPVGCEGIDLVDGEHALIAEDPRSFADACLRLLGEADLRQRLADNAASLFERAYTWEAIGDTVADLVQSVGAAATDQSGA